MAQIDRALSSTRSTSPSTPSRGRLLFARRFDEAATEARKALAMEPGNPVACRRSIRRWPRRASTKSSRRDQDYLTGFYGVPDPGPHSTARSPRAASRPRPSRPPRLWQRAQPSGGWALRGRRAVRLAGEKRQALDWLERDYQARDPNCPICGNLFFRPAALEPRYQSLVHLLKLTTQ